MAIGNRIRLFRTRMGLTQKELGEKLGFLGRTSDVRMAQYESESRTPKSDLVRQMSEILQVDPRAITVPDIDNTTGLMHTLFALEDLYGLTAGAPDGGLTLTLDDSHEEFLTMSDMIHTWQIMKAQLAADKITREDYDNWRYRYPKNAVPTDFSSMVDEEIRKKLK